MRLQDLPIKRKIVAVNMLVTLAVLVLTVTAFMAYDLTTYRKVLLRNLSTLGRVVADESTAALALESKKSGREILASLRHEPQILAAALYSSKGELFVTYTNSPRPITFPPPPEREESRFEGGQLSLFEPVWQDGTRLGTLYLKADLGVLHRRLVVYSGIAALIVLGSLALALALSERLQKHISEPLITLSDTARQVSERGDFSVRAPWLGGDEVGLLTNAFNQMLTRIQEQTVALRDSEQRLRLALEASRTGTWDWNLQTHRIVWGNHSNALFGLKPGEFGGSFEHFVSLVLPEDRDMVREEVRQAIEQSREFSCEYRVKWPDGSVHDLFSRGRVFADAEGKPIRMTGVTHDITARKQQEEIRALLAAIIDSSSDAIIGKDPTGRVVSWNAGAEHMFGYTAEEMLGESILRICSPDRQEEEQKVLERARQGETREYETVRIRKDGRPVSISLTVSPIRVEGGQIVGLSSIARDITDRKEAERQILRLNAELERRVQARTAELTAANNELEAFTYSVAHDLRAPLRHIDAFTRILAEDFSAQLPPEAKRYLEIVRKGSQNMSRLVDDLLNLARVGRQELKREATPLNEIVEQVIADLKGEIGKRQVEWHVECLPTVDGDPGLLKQVFANLLSNAVKYTRPRNKAVIEVGQRRMNGNSAIYVRDNGVGFSMNYADKLFGVFQRLHRSEEFEGTGVGLAIVERVIRRHGGRVWAESELDQGATFYFTLNGLDKGPGAD